MQNSIWKLTTLAGVIGVGFLIVLQAQDGLNQDDHEQHALVPAGQPGPADANLGDAIPSDEDRQASFWQPGQPAGPDELQENTEPPVAEHSEPDFGPGSSGFEPPPTGLAATARSLPDPSELPGLPAFDAEPVPADAFNETPRIPDSPAGVVSISEPDFGPDPFATNDTVPDGNVAAALPQPGRLVDEPSLTRPTVVTTVRNEITDSLLIEPVGNQVTSLPDLPGSLPEFTSDANPALATPAAASPLETQREMVSALPGLPEPVGSFPSPDTKLTSPLVADFPSALPVPPNSTDESASESETASQLIPLPGLSPEDDPFGPTPDESASPISAAGLELPGELPEFDSNIRAATAESGIQTASTATAVSGPAGTAEFPADAPAATQRPELTIEKNAPPDATLGKPMIYSIRIANRGDANAVRVVVEDQIPNGCRLVGTIPQAELIGTKLLWRLGRLASGEQKKLLIKVVPIEEGDVGSIATVNFTSEVATRTQVRQPAAPDLRVSMNAPPQANVGQSVVFSFKIENAGQRDAKDVSLQNLIPVGFQHAAGNDLTYDVGTIPAGKSFEIDLELLAVEPGRHTNRAIVKTTGGATTESKTIVEIIEQRGLKITASAGRASVVGQRFVQRITVTNESTQSVSDGTVTLSLGRQLRFISASNDGIHDKPNHQIQWQLPPMEPGQSVNLETIAIAGQAGSHTCQIQLKVPGRDAQGIEVVRTVRGIAALQLDLTDVPATVFPGDEFAVRVRLLNRGTGADSNIQFGLHVPSELEIVKALGPVKHLPPTSTQGGRQISFKAIPEIGEGASVDFEITLRARTPGRPKLRAEVRSDQLTEPVASEAAVVVIDTAP
jgi:uncharacterized repeat protein (TIGR01451 family)